MFLPFSRQRAIYKAHKSPQRISKTPQEQPPSTSRPRSGSSLSDLISPKLRVGADNDPLERQADKMAETVMSMPTSFPLGNSILNRKPVCSCGGSCPTCRAKAAPVEAAIDSPQPGGHPLPDRELHFFSSRFGANFSNVSIHDDARAASLAESVNARAFTHGPNVVFGAGEYAPGTVSGRKLIAHELAHVSQQRFLALSGAEASEGNIQRKESTEKTDEAAKKRESFADDMMRGMKPPEELKKLRKRIITALKAFSLGQLRRMKKAGVRFWLAPELPPKLAKFITPPKLKTPAQYIKEARVIQVRVRTKTGHMRHELAHAWDHARALKGKRLRRFDALSRKQITREIELGSKMWSSSKSLKNMLKKYKDRLPHPVKEHTFESPVTAEKHSLKSTAEFYAEGYNVFHGHYLSGQARLLKYAPELYKLLEKEAKKNGLPIPDRKEVEKEIKSQKLP